MDQPLFTLCLRDGLSAIHTGEGIFNLKALTAAAAHELWQGGVPHVHITRYGALKYYKRASVKVITSCMAMCKTVAEVRALQAVKPASAQLRKACTARVRALRRMVVRG